MAVARPLILISRFALMLARAGPATSAQAPPDPEAVARKVREVIRAEYAEPIRFNYTEEGRDVDVSMFGKVSEGPLETYEVRQEPPGEAWRRLVARDGKPLAAAELARRDADHQKKIERLRAESPRQRAAREKAEAEELRERDEILDDAERVFAFNYVGRDTIDGHAVIVADLKPRLDARVTTAEGQRMKRFAGRVWVAAADYHIARVRLHATDSVSVGWGVVARVERGSGFEFLRKKVAGSWVASQLTIEGSGNTLLFRSFHIKTVTTYSNHEPYKPDEP